MKVPVCLATEKFVGHIHFFYLDIYGVYASLMPYRTGLLVRTVQVNHHDSNYAIDR
jgi:hypothetical protein